MGFQIEINNLFGSNNLVDNPVFSCSESSIYSWKRYLDKKR